MTGLPERDWMIVAPWWQWTDPATVPPGTPVGQDLRQGRLSRPVLQKYDSPGLVNTFLKNPQHCLKFVEEDLVHAVQPVPGPSASLAGKLFRLGASRQNGTVIDQQYVPDGTNTRKVFLDTHKRFYLVLGEIHCDGPGFPSVDRAKICKAGFVIRRRTVTVPAAGLVEVKPILRSLAAGRAGLARVTQLAAVEGAALEAATGTQNGAGGVQSARVESLVRTRASLQALVLAERERFDDWTSRFGVFPRLEGWLTSPEGFDKIGVWGPVDEMPAELGLESSFPLYPLIPDRNDPGHAGNFGTIYFGVLPTGSHDCDRTGAARFDDRELYEVRCWAARHLRPHDPDQPCPCPDGIFWSVPTAPYKLAPHFDLAGTGHQPVTVQLPDLNTLAAQAKPALGVGFAKPPGSLMISGFDQGKPKNHSRSSKFEICFIPIPLITIVATFVFELFLPVVMLVFQLWWMLALKLCIPPELDVAAGVSGEIAIDGNLAVDAGVEASIAASVDAKVSAQFDADTASALIATYSPIALANLEVRASAAADPQNPGAPSTVANLDFEAEVTHA
jgi:hypothetical protein